MIGYDGIDVSGIRLHPAVIANHTKLSHYYELVRAEAKKYLITLAVKATKNYETFVEPSLFFVDMFTTENKALLAACEIVLDISGVKDDWTERFTPDDLVRIFLGTEEEPSVIDKLNYPVKAKQTKQALDNGLPFELQALITCMFLTEYGDYETAKEMIEGLTPEQLEVIVTTKTLLTKRANGSDIKSTKQLADMANVSEETAAKVLQLVGL